MQLIEEKSFVSYLSDQTFTLHLMDNNASEKNPIDLHWMRNLSQIWKLVGGLFWLEPISNHLETTQTPLGCIPPVKAGLESTFCAWLVYTVRIESVCLSCLSFAWAIRPNWMWSCEKQSLVSVRPCCSRCAPFR